MWKPCRRNVCVCVYAFLSTAGHEKPCWNSGGPPSKAKYKQLPIAYSTVRERWKEPRKGSEIESETIDLQAVRAMSNCGDGVPFVEWACELRCIARLRNRSSGAEGKPSLNRALLVVYRRPEAKWSIHVQAEVGVRPNGGPNLNPLKRVGMRCGSEWKAKQTWR